MTKRRRRVHSADYMDQLKRLALPSHGEDSSPPRGMSRREMLSLASRGSLLVAMGALAGCQRKPKREIVSRAQAPEYQEPGKALYYATTDCAGPVAYGMLVKAMDGRPIKIEGDPEHPLNRGSSSAALQALILSLYDPDRLQRPLVNGAPASWETADATVSDALARAERVAVVTRGDIGPSEGAMLDEFLKRCPAAKHYVLEPVDDAPRRAATERIFGAAGEWAPELSRAKVVVSLDADFLGVDGANLAHTLDWTASRDLEEADAAHAAPSRTYCFESGMTVTGSNADQRVPLRPSDMGRLARALLEALQGDPGAMRDLAGSAGVDLEALVSLAHDLRQAGPGQAVVLAGPHLPESVHAATALLNHEIRAYGQTLLWNPEPPHRPATPRERLIQALKQADAVLCLGVNPEYDLGEGVLSEGQFVAVHDLYPTESVEVADVALPSAHTLESWNDRKPRAGLESICQPLIAPLFESRQEADSLLAWSKALATPGDAIHDIEDWHGYLKARWDRRHAQGGPAWLEVLKRGFIETDVRPAPMEVNIQEAERLAGAAPEAGAWQAVIRPHHSVYDGRFAANAWLQELPDPVTKQVWGNAAAISPASAAELGVGDGDMLEVSVGGASVALPAAVQRGVAPGVAVLTLGHGRRAGGLVIAEADGANVAPLMQGRAPRCVLKAGVKKGQGRGEVVRTQKERQMQGRDIVVDGTLDEYRHDPAFVKHKQHVPDMVDLYEPFEYGARNFKWGMAIDLNRCTGCGACVASCQAENNIAVVGREECANGREMHWMRIDRYEEGDPANPRIHLQPMLCQQCDNAPCEPVCPMNATVHSPEGLNEMAYNRCVGTRFCSNNCPYKVRRFNFLHYHTKRMTDAVQELVFNPEVTVRDAGVMEKCTFCVQRINKEKFEAYNAGRPLRDGTVVPACAQACPAQAIVFGNLNDPDSRVSKMRESGRAFYVLPELNAKPVIAYLARVRNPGVADAAESEGGGHA